MSLDLAKSLAQLPVLVDRLNLWSAKKKKALENAGSALQKLNVADTNSRASNGKATWLASVLTEHPLNAHSANPVDSNHIVMAVDGSHIDVDRHASAFYYLINIGYASFRYGEHSDAQLWNNPYLYANDSDLVINDSGSTRAFQVEGPLLGIKRAVKEIEALADLIESEHTKTPIIALLDGSLIFWSLSSQAYPDFVRESLLKNKLLHALDRIRLSGHSRKIALASYISLPRSKELVNSLRLSICPHEPIDCDKHCGKLNAGVRPCDDVNGLFDIDLMQKILKDSERSAIFSSASKVMDYYEEHQICYFYINTGNEISRVELPCWVAEDEKLLDLLHAGLLAQLHKGQGYPIALQEAHEQAVVSTTDREYFTQLVQELMTKEGLPVDTSEKSRSKRTRFV